MIRQHFEDEMAELNREIMKMGIKVEEAVRKAVEALKNKDVDRARDIIEDDNIINNLEKELCDKCALIIAKQQPVASDLRHLISGIKIITDLERIGDHAVHIAKATIKMAPEDYIKPLVDIPRMAEMDCRMLSKAVTAYVEKNSSLAKETAADDEIIDELHKQILRELLTYMLTNPKNIDGSLSLMYISRFLERIGDHACNICEWVVFSETGEHENL